MAATNTKCPKCGSAMEEGFVLDRGDHLTVHAADWVEGEPDHSFFGGVTASGKRRYALTSYRCTRCGYLESYAREENG